MNVINYMILDVHLIGTQTNPIIYNNKEEWIDIAAKQDVYLMQYDTVRIPLGFSMRIPKGFEAHLLQRSSNFSKYGTIQTNGMGIIDRRFSGTDDEWSIELWCTKNAKIKAGERIAQFRLVENMEGMLNRCGGYDARIEFVFKDKLDSVNRGGFGSTGR